MSLLKAKDEFEMVKSRVKVSICNVPYTLVGDEDDSHVFRAAAYVDSAMRTLLDGGIVEREKAAVLVALQLASKMLKDEQCYVQKDEEIRRLSEKLEREMRLFI